MTLSQTRSPSIALAVGDPRRRAIGRGIRMSLIVGALFCVVSVGVKDYKPLTDFAPWAEDPYDAFVSFGMFFVAMVAGLSLLRLPACRANEPLPISRAAGMLRAATILLATTIITFGASWISVASAGRPDHWDPKTTALIAVLALETVIAIAAARSLVLASRGIADLNDRAAGPDWVDDLVLVADRASRRFGAASPLVARLVAFGDQVVASSLRTHSGRGAIILSASLGVFFAVGALLEGDPALLAVLIGLIGTAGTFAFASAAGAYLGLVASGTSPRSKTSPRSSFVLAAIVMSASVTIALAFRDSLWWLIGSDATDAKLPELAALLGLVAIASFVIALVALTVIRRR